MREKADKLVTMKHAICEIPDHPNSRRVTSLSNLKCCHYIECEPESGNAYSFLARTKSFGGSGTSVIEFLNFFPQP
jgi:hypothetical protein